MADLAAEISSPTEGARLRTGTVAGLRGASTVTVDVGGGQLVDMPTLNGYIPIPGDVVQILQQGSVQLVLGGTDPMSGGNVLANPSFELDQPGAAPSFWTKVIDAGTPTGNANVKTDNATGWGPVDGSKWLEINQSVGTAVTVHVVSEPIPVTAGQIWTAAASAANISADADGGGCQLRLSWYSSNTSTYPAGTVTADTFVAGVVLPPYGIPRWTLLRQWYGSGYPVPTGASWMRVVLSSDITGGLGFSAYWDGIICRLIGA